MVRDVRVRGLIVLLAVASTLSGCFFPTMMQVNPPPPQQSSDMQVGRLGPTPSVLDAGSITWDRSPADDPAVGLTEQQMVWEWGVRWGGIQSGGPMLPRRVHPLHDIVAVAAGLEHGLALRSDGTVWTWGNGRPGLGGIAAEGNNDMPTQMGGLTDVVAIAAGDFHNLALRTDGTVWSWGYNGAGQLGDGSRESRSTPQVVEELDDVVAIATGMGHSLALRGDGTVRTWGYGALGAIGDGTRESRLTPGEVLGLVDVISIAAGGRHSLAVRADGTVWGWGFGLRGAIGDVSHDSPVPIPIEGLSDIAQVAAGWNHSLAVTAGGELYTWGGNDFGQLGHGVMGGMSNLPQRVENLPTVLTAAGGEHFSTVVTFDGQIFIWGDDAVTTLRRGDGTRASPATPRPVAALHHMSQVAARGSSVVAIQSNLEHRLATPHFVRGAH